MTLPAVHLHNVSQQFGELKAVKAVNLSVAVGERRAILGPNGAGKTTLFNLICGDHSPTEGTVSFLGEDVTRLQTYQRTRLGIGRTYQSSLLFNGLSVLENLYVAVRGVKANRFSFLQAGSNDEHMEVARRLAARVRLDRNVHRKVDELSHGERRLLELGMALASDPKLLMLDEPAAGLSPVERPELIKVFENLPKDLTLILIEHDMDIALSTADYVTIMKDGAVVAEDVSDRIGDNPVVQAIYLGGEH